MNINALWALICKLEPEYFNLMDEVSSCFLQEIMNPITFNDEELRRITFQALLDEIEGILDKDLTRIAQNCAIEFCLTNEYIFEGREWNCINHILERHKDLLSANSKKYLKALNNSYMGVYKVVSVEPNISITLKDMVGSDNKDYITLNRDLSKVIKPNQIIATRLLKFEQRQTKSSEYHLSNSVIVLPEEMAEQCLNAIQMLIEVMNQPCILILSLANNYKILGALSRKLVYCNQP
jgi:hypothetical protein